MQAQANTAHRRPVPVYLNGDRLTDEEAADHHADQLDDAVMATVRARRVATLFGENRKNLLRCLTNGILDHLSEFGELDKLVIASLEGNAVDLGTVINHVMVNDALADLDEDQDETPKVPTLFQRMLDDHQRSRPHHADQCAICRDAARVLR